ncbi:hypothetical protein AAG906_012255 [Vitis piasezkii]
MAYNKERIEALEVGLGRLHHLEETINKLSEALLSTKEPSETTTTIGEKNPLVCTVRRTMTADRISLPKWKSTTNNQKASLASFHLEGEANQWWQWWRRAYREEDRLVTWESFEEVGSFWSHRVKILMKPYPKFDKSILHDYQNEFREAR